MRVLLSLALFSALAAFGAAGCSEGPAPAAASTADPVKGMVTMIDLGADTCVPCKMMAPILVELKEAYKGKAAIVFVDVWKDNAPARRYGIRAIPTQIFFDREGREAHRHEGFMDRGEIVAVLKRLGVS